MVLLLRAWTQCAELGAVRILHALQTHHEVCPSALPLHGIMLAKQAVNESSVQTFAPPRTTLKEKLRQDYD